MSKLFDDISKNESVLSPLVTMVSPMTTIGNNFIKLNDAYEKRYQDYESKNTEEGEQLPYWQRVPLNALRSFLSSGAQFGE